MIPGVRAVTRIGLRPARSITDLLSRLGPHQHDDLPGQLIVITGASSGIGESAARLFAARGADGRVTLRGARHAALMYSLLGTCKLNNVEPFAYLRDVIARISEHKANKLTELLPQNWQPLAK